MPGYGYASAPKAKVASWTALIHKFLQGRSNLARVYVLIDARHGLKDVDLDVLKTLDKSAVSYQVVLTKADQVKPAELEQRIAEVKAALSKHPAAFPEVLATSSRTGAGMPELRAAMVRLLEERRPMMGFRLFRILVILAGVMGADGVILAAAVRPSGRRGAAGAGLLDAAVSRHRRARGRGADRARHRSCQDRACRRLRLRRRGRACSPAT